MHFTTLVAAPETVAIKLIGKKFSHNVKGKGLNAVMSKNLNELASTMLFTINKSYNLDNQYDD